MNGALGFDPRAVLARIQGDAPRPDAAEFSRLASLAAPNPSNSHSVASAGAGAEALAARLLRLAVAGAEALAADDPDLNAERSLLAAHYVAPPSDRPYVPGDPDPLRDGLLAGALGARSHVPPLAVITLRGANEGG